MEFDSYGLLVLGHVLFASLWFGAAVYQVRVIGGALRAAGPAAGGFLVTLMRRGGIGTFFAIAGGLTILFGLALFGVGSADDRFEPMEGRGIFLSLGAVVAVLAYLHGMFANMPNERKLIALCRSVTGHPTKEQGEQMGALGAKLGKQGAISMMMIAVAMLLMLLSRVFY